MRRNLRRARSEQGFTIVELTVASAVALIITTATMTVLYRTFNDTAIVTSRARQQNDGRIALERMTNDIRQATGTTTATANYLSIDTIRSGTGHSVIWWLNGDDLQLSTDGGAFVTMVGNIENGANDLFTYGSVDPPTINKVTIKLQIGTKPSATIPLETTVLARNL